MRAMVLVPVVALLALPGAPALADDRKEVFHHAGCRVEREWKKDGEYKEKRECKDIAHGMGEGKEEFHDRGCKVIREWKWDGEYKEEIECKARS